MWNSNKKVSQNLVHGTDTPCTNSDIWHRKCWAYFVSILITKQREKERRGYRIDYYIMNWIVAKKKFTFLEIKDVFRNKRLIMWRIPPVAAHEAYNIIHLCAVLINWVFITITCLNILLQSIRCFVVFFSLIDICTNEIYRLCVCSK